MTDTQRKFVPFDWGASWQPLERRVAFIRDWHGGNWLVKDLSDYIAALESENARLTGGREALGAAWRAYDEALFDVLEGMRQEERTGKQFEARWLAAATRIARLPERTTLRAAITEETPEGGAPA